MINYQKVDLSKPFIQNINLITYFIRPLFDKNYNFINPIVFQDFYLWIDINKYASF